MSSRLLPRLSVTVGASGSCSGCCECGCAHGSLPACFLFSGGTSGEGESKDQRVGPCGCLYLAAPLFCIPMNNSQHLDFSTPSPALVISCFLITSTLMGVTLRERTVATPLLFPALSTCQLSPPPSQFLLENADLSSQRCSPPEGARDGALELSREAQSEVFTSRGSTRWRSRAQ